MNRVVQVVDHAFQHTASEGSVHDFKQFVKNVLHRAEVRTPEVLVALVYIDRAKPYLEIPIEEWARERVFLGALIVASKVTFTSSLAFTWT